MEALGCSAIIWAASTFLACLEDALEEAAGRTCCAVKGPILPNLLVLVRGWELRAGILESSLDFALPAAGDTHTLDPRLEADPEVEDFFVRLPVWPGGFNRVFFSPNLLGTGSDRLPGWPALLAASGTLLGLSGSTLLWDPFSFRSFIL